MQDDGRWVTLKDGRRVKIKTTSEYMNDLLRNKNYKLNKSDQSNIKEASHITTAENYDQIIKEGFKLDKVGTGAGTVFGNGVYFTDKENERQFYFSRLGENYDTQTNTWDSKEIKVDIDTTGFLEVEYNDFVSSTKKMYNEIANNMKLSEKKLYNKSLKEIKQRNKIAVLMNDSRNWSANPEKEALMPIIEKNYPGLIVKQNTTGLDPLTGGNQIVVYDIKRIKIKE